ncbi:MAG: peptide ABC transporter substrate-binding protein [Aliidongia sp.]
MSRSEYRRRIWPAFAVILLLASAAAPAETILQRGNKNEPETLDPQKSDGVQEYWVQSDMFEGLTRIDPLGKIVPGVAESWDIAPDGLAWTFHLRPDLKWSDGSPLTAEDFVWSLRRAVDPRTAASYASILYPVVGARAINEGKEKDLAKLGVEAPDPRTLIVRLTEPTAYLAGVATLGIMFPIPRKAVEAYGEEWTRPGHIVGDGAFVMDSWTPQLEIRLKRNPNYYDAGAVKIDTVVWSVNEDDETALKRYRSGDLDIARVPHRLVPVLKKERPGELHTGAQLWTRFIIVNTQRQPFSDVRLRQALAMLIDRDIINQKLDPHDQLSAYGLIPPGIEGYVPQPPDWATQTQPERVERGKALIQAAGFGPGNPARIEIIYPADEDQRRILTAIAAMVKPYGIDFVPQAEENQVVESTTRNHDFEGALYGWQADYPDAWTFLSPYKSDSGGLDTPDYRNLEYDALLLKAIGTLDPAARNRVLEQAEQIFNRDQPVIPLSYDNWPRRVSPKVSGYFDNPLDQHQSRDLEVSR